MKVDVLPFSFASDVLPFLELEDYIKGKFMCFCGSTFRSSFGFKRDLFKKTEYFSDYTYLSFRFRWTFWRSLAGVLGSKPGKKPCCCCVLDVGKNPGQERFQSSL